MSHWIITYWDGQRICQTITPYPTDIWGLMSAIGSTPASSYTYAILSIERAKVPV